MAEYSLRLWKTNKGWRVSKTVVIDGDRELTSSTSKDFAGAVKVALAFLDLAAKSEAPLGLVEKSANPDNIGKASKV